MTDKILKKAQELKNQISELEGFLWWFDKNHFRYIDMLFGKVKKKKEKAKLSYQSSTSSIVNGDYELTYQQKEKVVEILREDLARLKEEYARLGTEENE